MRTQRFAGIALLSASLIGCLAQVGCDQQPADTTGVQASTASGEALVDSTEYTAEEQARASSTTAAPDSPAPALPPMGAPPVVFEPAEVNFGILTPGQSSDATLRIRNTGPTPLTVASTKVSCTCTTIDLKDTVIQPGETAEMEVRYKGKLVLGPSTAKVRVLFEDYEDHLLEVTVVAEIALAIRAEPAFIKATESDYGQIKISSQDGLPFRVLTVNGDTPDLVDFNPDVDEPRNTYFMRWDIRDYNPTTCANLEGEPMPPWVAVETDHPECPIFDIYLRHRCTIGRPPVAPRTWLLSDRRILMGGVPAGEPYEFTVNMKWLRNAPPDDIARSVSAQSDNFTAELVDAVTKEDVVQLTIHVTPNSDHRGLIYDKIWIHGAKGSCDLLMVGTAQAPTV